MTHPQWVTIPAWGDPAEDPKGPDSDFENPFPIGHEVRNAHSVRMPAGRTGKVVSWGRSVDSDQHWRMAHSIPVTCRFGSECDALVDSEGPVIRWDDLPVDSEELDWFPGQSMSVIEPA